MTDVEVIEIEGQEYLLADSIENNGKTYYYFSNEKDVNDIYILQDSIKDGEEYYSSLDDKDEFDYALTIFLTKHKDDDLNETTNE